MDIDPRLINRFNEKWEVDEKSGCHVWTGAKLPKGYGIIKRPRERRQFYAHRLSWMIYMGEIPSKVQVCHHCDNPACVNPDHLFLGTVRDNLQDMKAKGRHLYGEKNGWSRLEDRDVQQIHSLSAAGYTQKRISEMFGVAQGQISRIVRGEQWGHLHPSHLRRK